MKRKNKGFPFRILWNMKNLTDGGAVEWISGKLRYNKARSRKMWESAKNLSNGNSEDPHVRYDPRTGFWRGRFTRTLRESVGIERGGIDSSGTIRSKYQRLTSRPREEVIAHIMLTEDCYEEEAEKTFRTGVNNRKPVFQHDKSTNMWRGALAPEPTPDTVPHYKMTDAQLRFRFQYGDMPEMVRIDAILWIADRNKCSTEEAEITFDQIRNCTTITAIKPIVFDHESGLWMGYRTTESLCQEPDTMSSPETAEEKESTPDEFEDSDEQDEQDEDDESGEQEWDEPRQLEPWEILMAEEEARERKRVEASARSHFEAMRAMLN
jgi:hypothetical protein